MNCRPNRWRAAKHLDPVKEAVEFVQTLTLSGGAWPNLTLPSDAALAVMKETVRDHSMQVYRGITLYPPTLESLTGPEKWLGMPAERYEEAQSLHPGDTAPAWLRKEGNDFVSSSKNIQKARTYMREGRLQLLFSATVSYDDILIDLSNWKKVLSRYNAVDPDENWVYYSREKEVILMEPITWTVVEVKELSPKWKRRYSAKTVDASAKRIAKFEPYNLRAEAERLNKKYFKGALDLNFRITYSDIRRSLGITKALRYRSSGDIVVTELSISNVYDLPRDRFIAIMVHELIHVALFQRGIFRDLGRSKAHGMYFLAEVQRIRGMGLDVPLTEDASDLEQDYGKALKDPVYVAVADRSVMISFRRFSTPQIWDDLVRWLSRKYKTLELFRTTNPVVRSLPIKHRLDGKLSMYKMNPGIYEAIKSNLIGKTDLSKI